MATARDVYGTVFKNATAVMLARVVDADGAPIAPEDVDAAEYSVLELDPCDPDASETVAGHDGVALAPESVLYASLQTDGAWSVDDEGYNFRHEIDVSTDDAFGRAGAVYQVRYELTPVVGQKTVFRFLVRAL